MLAADFEFFATLFATDVSDPGLSDRLVFELKDFFMITGERGLTTILRRKENTSVLTTWAASMRDCGQIRQ